MTLHVSHSLAQIQLMQYSPQNRISNRHVAKILESRKHKTAWKICTIICTPELCAEKGRVLS